MISKSAHPPTPNAFEVLELLEGKYGPPDMKQGRMSPIDELIACILSQHTSDVNSFRAFDNLRAKYGSWDEVEIANTEEIADTIRCGGLANSKSVRIQEVLKAIRLETGTLNLDCLGALSDTEARDWLLKLPGVGPKTAAIVLCFALGRPVIPVDTHVFRVAWRMGFIEKKIGEGKAHDVLQALIPPEIIFRFHVALINHGRQTCKAPTPRCEGCIVKSYCRFHAQVDTNIPDNINS